MNDLEDIKYFESRYQDLLNSINGINNNFDTTINKTNERIAETLHLILDGYGNIVNLLKEMWDKANELEKQDFLMWLNNETELFDDALKPLDAVLRSWPEYIEAKKEGTNGKDA